jgi:hypothetical protein
MKPHCLPAQSGASACVGVLLTVIAVVRGSAQGFDPGCAIPFDSIRGDPPIDHTCPRRGNVPDPAVADNDAAHALQNEAKNDFCEPGPPAPLTFFSFMRLQQKLDAKVPAAQHWNRDHLPPDRSVLASIHTTTDGMTIGERSVVRVAAWLLKLRKGGKESCNCEETKKDSVDLHLVLIQTSDREHAEECTSVTAEISPHARPQNWDGETLLSANHHPLRLTGQLMYDAAHRPCFGDPPAPRSGAPARVSSWEIHPVYGIDICKKRSLRSCKAGDESVWIPLDQWPGDE